MTADDLLLALLIAPDDAALRAVYVDSLIERGDPRGEHARLQQQGRHAEAAALQRAHGSKWLPAEWNRYVVAGSERYRDGVLEHCALLPMPAAEAQRLAADPLWAVVRGLESPPAEIVAQATALRTLSEVDSALLSELAGWKTRLPRLEHLGLRVARLGDALAEVLALELPALESLSVRSLDDGLNARHSQEDPIGLQCCEECGRGAPLQEAPAFEPSRWAALFDSDLGRRLRALELHAGYVELSRFIPALEATRCDVKELRLRGAEENGTVPAWCLRLEQTGPGRYRRLVVEARGETDEDAFDWNAIVETAPKDLEVLRRGR